jgi:transposase
LEIIKSIEIEKIVYVDESGMNDNDFYPYAYSPIGKRHYESKPGHYTKRISMIGGIWGKQFQAPFMFEGHCNTATFEVYIERVLIPSLKPGMSIVIDNASFHKSSKTKEMIEEAGCQLIFLPPYSPDLNPIEHYWHKIKTKIRKLMRDTQETLNDAMGIALKNMSIC